MMHHKAKVPYSVVEQIRALHRDRVKKKQMLKILEEMGYIVSIHTLNDWLYYRTRTGNFDKSKKLSPNSMKYRRLMFEKALEYAPTIYPCKTCGYPVAKGYRCGHCGDVDPSNE